MLQRSIVIVCYFVFYKPRSKVFFLIFFFNDTATTEIYTLSLHDALPIFWVRDLKDVNGNRTYVSVGEANNAGTILNYLQSA